MVKKVAVFFGGKSAEREISVLTGVLALRLIDPAKYAAVPVYVHSDGGFYTSDEAFYLETFKTRPFPLKKFRRCVFENDELLIFAPKKDRLLKREKIDVMLNCCHGGAGENGGVAALSELFSVPSASPSVAACSVCMDKEWTKLFLSAAGIPVLDYVVLTREEYVRRGALALKDVKKKGFPLIVKPASSGSSIGIALIENEEGLKKATEEAFLYGDKILFEPYLENKTDINCAAYRRNGKICVSEPEAAFGDGVYGFKEKYMKEKPRSDSGDTADKSAARTPLDEEEIGRIKAYTSAIYRRLETLGVIRVDFLKSGENLYVGEINAVPGSLAYYLFCERLIDGRRFLSDLLEEPFSGAKRDVCIPETGVLESVATGGKRGFTGIRL